MNKMMGIMSKTHLLIVCMCKSLRA